MTLDLGTTSLSQVRLARGLTLEDAEHSTRISRRFLIALEEHDYSVFPAPVYARGFLRTYCRYLGIDPEQQLSELPAGWTGTAPDTQLAPVSTRGPMTFNVAWIVAGALLAAVIGIGVFLANGDSGLDGLQGQPLAEGQTEATTTTESSALLPDPTATSTRSSGSSARALEIGLPGSLPDFTDVPVDDVTDYLNQEDIPYLRIDTASSTTAAGLVIRQTPAAGASTDDLGQVTLTVSTGPSSAGSTSTRTDCEVLAAASQRTAAEQTYFEDNCEPSAPAVLPDRTDCEEIRGTDYRSPEERTFFLANCTTQ